MESFALDTETGDRLLYGVLQPDDVPDRYSAVAALLQAAAVTTSSALDGDAAMIDLLVATIRSAPGFVAPRAARTKRSPLSRAKIAAAGLVGAMTLSTGLAAANALPAPAQQAAANALGVVGVHVPNPHDDEVKDHPPGDSTAGNESGKDASVPTSVPAAGAAHPDNNGGQISGLAHNTDPGAGHGAAVSGEASNGKSQAGEPHGNATKPDHPTGPPASTPAGQKRSDSAGSSSGNSSEGNNSANGNRNGADPSGQSDAGGRKP
jgi:hypothetical protein